MSPKNWDLLLLLHVVTPSFFLDTLYYFTCESFKPSWSANFFRSGLEMYFCTWNLLSRPFLWISENTALLNIPRLAFPSKMRRIIKMISIFGEWENNNCQTRVQTISRSTLDASQVLSNSISISDSGGLDLSRHYNCFIPPTHHHQKTFWSILEHSRIFYKIPEHSG